MSRPPLVFEGTSCPPSNSPRDLTVMAVDPAATGTSPDGNPDGDSWSWSARWWSQPSWDWSADDATWWPASADWSSSAAERACWPPASWFEDAHMESSVAASVPAPHPTEGPPKQPPPELPSSILFLFIETSLVSSFTSWVMLLLVCVSGRCPSAFHGSNFFLCVLFLWAPAFLLRCLRLATRVREDSTMRQLAGSTRGCHSGEGAACADEGTACTKHRCCCRASCHVGVCCL